MRPYNKITKRELGKFVGLCVVVVLAPLWGWFLTEGPREFVTETPLVYALVLVLLATGVRAWDIWRQRG